MADHQYEMAKTIVFWDREECKIPEGLEVGDVLKNIKMALEHIGYRGRVSIMATGDAKDDICSCKILMLKHFLRLLLLFFLIICIWIFIGERDARLTEVISYLMENSVLCNLLLVMKREND